MAKVLDFTGGTTVDIPPNKVLKGAIEQDLASVLVIGEDKKGDLYIAGSTSNVPEILFLLERFKFIILSGVN